MELDNSFNMIIIVMIKITILTTIVGIPCAHHPHHHYYHHHHHHHYHHDHLLLQLIPTILVPWHGNFITCSPSSGISLVLNWVNSELKRIFSFFEDEVIFELRRLFSRTELWIGWIRGIKFGNAWGEIFSGTLTWSNFWRTDSQTFEEPVKSLLEVTINKIHKPINVMRWESKK